jgi:DNA processing protein
VNTFCTFTQTELVSMVGPVRAEQPSADEATEVFARAAWSGIVEPGDRVAGILWSALGVQQSLECVISDEAPERMAARVGERLGDGDGMALLATSATMAAMLVGAISLAASAARSS